MPESESDRGQRLNISDWEPSLSGLSGGMVFTSGENKCNAAGMMSLVRDKSKELVIWYWNQGWWATSPDRTGLEIRN